MKFKYTNQKTRLLKMQFLHLKCKMQDSVMENFGIIYTLLSLQRHFYTISVWGMKSK